MSLKNKISEDLKQAMRDKNQQLVSVLRMAITAIRNKEIELRKGEDVVLSDEQVVEVIKSETKKRKDSIEAYKAAAREDLVKQESEELAILEKYLPEQMSEAEIAKIAKEVIDSMGEVKPSDFGKVMGQVMARVKGKADGGAVSGVIKKLLG